MLNRVIFYAQYYFHLVFEPLALLIWNNSGSPRLQSSTSANWFTSSKSAKNVI